MTDSSEKIQIKGDPSTQKSRTKSKRRDMFETAAISRNLLQSQNDDQQYTNQITQKQIIKKAQSNPIPKSSPQIKDKQQTHPVQIQINRQIKKTISLVQNIKDKGNAFIFEGSSQEQQQNDHHHITQNKKDSAIIFQDEDSQEAQKLSPPQTIQTKKSNTIQIFGQMVQVDEQFLQQEHPGRKKQQNTKIQQNTKKQIPHQPQPQQQQDQNKLKQLLRGVSVMPQNTFAKMKLIRNKQALGGTILSLRLQSNMRLIVAAKNTSSQTYIISQSLDNFQQNSKHYIGKIKASFFGNQLNLFTKGLNPQKSKIAKMPPRQPICTIVTHSQQIMEDVKPRDFTVYLLNPKFHYYKDLIGVQIYEEEISLCKLYNDYPENRNKIIMYENRKSKWNEKQKMHSLNMKGRAQLPSIKNFILESPNENGRQIMLFGKMEQNQFSFDIHHPLSPLVGMAIAISSFTHKSW